MSSRFDLIPVVTMKINNPIVKINSTIMMIYLGWQGCMKPLVLLQSLGSTFLSCYVTIGILIILS